MSLSGGFPENKDLITIHNTKVQIIYLIGSSSRTKYNYFFQYWFEKDLKQHYIKIIPHFSCESNKPLNISMIFYVPDQKNSGNKNFSKKNVGNCGELITFDSQM